MEEYAKVEFSRSQIEKAGKFFSKCLEENDDYEELRNTEKKGTKAQPSWLMIQSDGEICVT